MARKDFVIMRDLAVHTRVDPNERSKKLNKFIHTLATNEDVQTELAGWKMSFDNRLLEIQGRTLNAEKIVQIKKQTNARELVSGVHVFLLEFIFIYTTRQW